MAPSGVHKQAYCSLVSSLSSGWYMLVIKVIRGVLREEQQWAATQGEEEWAALQRNESKKVMGPLK